MGKTENVLLFGKSLGADGTMTCWDLESWNVFKKVDEPHNEMSALDFSHDGKIFATAGKVSYSTVM